MKNYVKVANTEGLVRDLSTGAIINNNVSDYENYLFQKEAAKKRREQIENQTKEIDNIKNELQDIKQLLLLLMDKNSSKG